MDARHVTVIMFTKEKFHRHVVPSFVHDGRHVNWDDIQNWIAEGATVTIRSPTDSEQASFKS